MWALSGACECSPDKVIALSLGKSDWPTEDGTDTQWEERNTSGMLLGRNTVQPMSVSVSRRAQRRMAWDGWVGAFYTKFYLYAALLLLYSLLAPTAASLWQSKVLLQPDYLKILPQWRWLSFQTLGLYSVNVDGRILKRSYRILLLHLA